MGWLERVDAMSASQQEEINPHESLVNDAEGAYGQWNSILGHVILTQDEVMSPIQDTIRGVRFKGEEPRAKHTDGTMNDLLDEYYRRRRNAEDKIRFLSHTFFEDSGMLDERVSYSPVRMIGWWVKNLSDEIDWILANGGTLEDPYDQSSFYDPNKIPPAFTDRDLTTEGIRKICGSAVILQGRTPSDVGYLQSKIDEEVEKNELLSGRTFTTRERTDATVQAIRHMLTRHRTVDTVLGIDLETTGLKPSRAWVINSGWLYTDLHDPTGRLYGGERRSYGVSKTRMMLGNPTENISGITTGELDGLKPLELDPCMQDEILDALTGGVPFVAHSAGFEDSFFKQNIDGYAEAKRDGLVKIIDSRKISQWLDDYDGKRGNHLEQYARHWNALDPELDRERHLGLEDSEIMLRAMGRHLRSITPQDEK